MCLQFLSTKNASLAAFNNPLIEYAGIIGMICGSISFTVYFYIAKEDFLKVFKNEELKFYLIFVSLKDSIRYGLFQVATFITTTGFTTADYTNIIIFDVYRRDGLDLPNSS